MNDQTDTQLLRAYAGQRSEPAFAELVRRHIDLVYSAALRMVCDAHLAQDVTQATFVALAKNATQLTARPVLSGWLHRTAQNIAAQAVRTDVRRRAREQEVATMNELLANSPEASWKEIAPHLDDALGDLDESDRDAVMLRYFEKKSAREMAAQLGISDDAAQKRVSRAVERLREFFSKKKITIGAGSLGILISANAVQAAPVGLAVTISAAALAGTAATTSTIIATATKTIAMTTLQKTLVAATVAVLTVAGIYEARQAAQLRDRVETLRQQQAPLVEQIEQLQHNFANATNRPADLLADNSHSKLNQDQLELLKLRGEVGLLRREAERLKQLTQSNREAEAKNNSDLPNDPELRNRIYTRQIFEGKGSDGQTLALHFRLFADSNGGWTPTNWLQLEKYESEYPTTGTNSFEFVHKTSLNLYQLGTNFDHTVVVREYTPWRDLDGNWLRVYGYADGHSQAVRVLDGNFTEWEKQNTYIPPKAVEGQ